MDDLENMIGAVRMKVCRGINLVPRDSKTSDPYASVTMGSQNFKTRKEKDNCNPEWNDEITLAITKTNRDLLVKLMVYDDDTFTADDEMGWAGIDIKSLMECGRMELEYFLSGTIVSRVHPSRENCLAEESKILWKDGNLVQDMTVRLRDVETGEVELQLKWVDITNKT